MSTGKSGGLAEWLYPALFLICAGWTVWHIPAFTLDLYPPENESLFGQIEELHLRREVIKDLPGVLGPYANPIDWIALLGLPLFFVLGARSVVIAPMEFQDYRPWDRAALFLGRVTMIMIAFMTCVMLYEVFLRYAIEAPTKWANELTLWIAGFVFLTSGFYAMQQRSHIRIFILYDVCPRWLQRVFDTLSTLIICIFAAGLVFGSYNQVFVTKFYRWEMFGTAFDPPIPATIQPMILIIMVLTACQSVANLIADWNREPEVHSGPDDLDDDELQAMKRSVGAD